MADENKKLGVLYLVATPIGNLQDISLRALEVLRRISLAAAEDTRHTAKLLSAHGISVRMISYREQNHEKISRHIIEALQTGADVALVSDAGTPGISDPGAALVAAVIKEGLMVVPIPGPVAAIAALSASGLPTDRFTFVGFLPRKPGSLQKILESLKGDPGTLVFYESPHRLAETLGLMARVFGPRRAVVARELTKQFECLERGTLAELAGRFAQGTKGEITLLVEGSREERPVTSAGLDLVIAALRSGQSLGAAQIAKLLSPLCGLDKRAVYQRAVACQARVGEEDNHEDS